MDRTRRVIPQEDRPVPYKDRIRTKTDRPSLYKVAYNALARKFCKLGATNDDLAELFDGGSHTIDAWIAAVPSFAAAVREGGVIPTSRATGRS